jgi:hypothetical protein
MQYKQEVLLDQFVSVETDSTFADFMETFIAVFTEVYNLITSRENKFSQLFRLEFYAIIYKPASLLASNVSLKSVTQHTVRMNGEWR